MKRLSLRFPKWSRRVFSLSFLLSLISGTAWFGLDQWGTVEGEFGLEKHPLIATLTKVHGAGAFIALISFGMILSAHVPAGWRAGWSRKSGLFLLGTIVVLILTAWGLYYCGDDELRQGLVYGHLSSGVMVPIALIVHLRSRRK
jgi:hypothetical protein